MFGKRRALLIGCGSERSRRIDLPWDDEGWKGYDLTTLDINASHKPDYVFDLQSGSWPFPENSFDRVDAYEVLEHLGTQGDYRSFFRDFSEAWRVLRPGGFFCGTCPSYRSMWAWGDPSHTRVLTSGSLAFLDQSEYQRQVGVTPMSDFRFCYKADFEVQLPVIENEEEFKFVLKAIKPSRWQVPKAIS